MGRAKGGVALAQFAARTEQLLIGERQGDEASELGASTGHHVRSEGEWFVGPSIHFFNTHKLPKSTWDGLKRMYY